MAQDTDEKPLTRKDLEETLQRVLVPFGDKLYKRIYTDITGDIRIELDAKLAAQRHSIIDEMKVYLDTTLDDKLALNNTELLQGIAEVLEPMQTGLEHTLAGKTS